MIKKEDLKKQAKQVREAFINVFEEIDKLIENDIITTEEDYILTLALKSKRLEQFVNKE